MCPCVSFLSNIYILKGYEKGRRGWYIIGPCFCYFLECGLITIDAFYGPPFD
jgi:hypothetical protein